ncbi:MAG: SipW-dependent-type signal peptide-containing protein [Bifidobacteriaceae bacterium]|jgi:predicted ribosomally synthesized peptide with SipW-like signal peptide|nr:SipW-dependent-type signal peptide-containing protein [Bifidobacteriaceae bacterium]
MSNLLKSRRAKGMVAAACGLALLLTGGTMALWNDSASVGGGTITAGNLELKVGQFKALDVSTNHTADSTGYTAGDLRSDEATDDKGLTTCGQPTYPGHWIQPDGDESEGPDGKGPWRITPGDSVAVIVPLGIGLQGDNIVADLKLENAANGASHYISNNLTVSDVLLSGPDGEVELEDTIVGDVQTLLTDPDNAAPAVLARFQGPDEAYGQQDAPYVQITDIVAPNPNPTAPNTYGTPNYCLIVTFDYDPEVGDVDWSDPTDRAPEGNWSADRTPTAPVPTYPATGKYADLPTPIYTAFEDDGSSKNPVATGDAVVEYNRFEVGDVILQIQESLRITLQQTRTPGVGLF